MTPSTIRLSPAGIALIAATLLLSACHHDAARHNGALAAPPKEAGSRDTPPQSGVLPATAAQASVAHTSSGACLALAVARKAQPASACTFTRDPGPQSHFMMLNLCRSQERRAAEEQQTPQEKLIVRPKNCASPAASS